MFGGILLMAEPPVVALLLVFLLHNFGTYLIVKTARIPQFKPALNTLPLLRGTRRRILLSPGPRQSC